MHTFFDRFWEFAGSVSIRTKILGLVLSLVLLAGLGNTLLTRTVLFRNMEQQLQDQSVSVSRDLAARAEEPILLNNMLTLQDLLDETKNNNSNFSYAFIINSGGDIIAHTFGEGFPQDLLQKNSVKNDENHHTVLIDSTEGLIFDTAVPILNGKLGIARIGLSNKNVQNAVSTANFQAISFTIIILVLGTIVALLLTRILTRPLSELVRVTRKVSEGDYTQRIQPWAKDELGVLAQAFNQMNKDLTQLLELRKEREVLQRQLLEKVISSQEAERQRIARELHDSTSQSLTSLLVGMRTLEANCSKIEKNQVSELRNIAAETLDEVHKLAMQLRPSVLDDMGLSAALERLIYEWQSRYKITVDLALTIGNKRLPDVIETSLYRIIQEALTNIIRHANAESVSILLERRNNKVIAVIEDDGMGFEIKDFSQGSQLGLLGMKERTELLDGKLTIESNPDHGTSVFVEIPLKLEETKNDH